MKQIFFHVGPDKTGTSAIQYWMVNNGTCLDQLGISYPVHDFDVNNISSGNGDKYLYRKDKKFCLNSDLLLQDIQKFERSDAKVLLISCENLWHVMDTLQKKIPDAKIIFYIRLGVDYEESAYNQVVKRHNVGKKFKDLKVNHRIFGLATQKIDYSRVIFRFYAAQLFVNNNIVCDLLNILGVDTTAVKISTNRVVNSSYTFEALEFKRFLNRLCIDEFKQKVVDKYLQSYQDGIESFSLYDEKSAKRKNVELFKDLELKLSLLGINKCEFDEYRSLVLNRPLRVYMVQVLSQSDCEEVLQFIQKKDIGLYIYIIQEMALHERVDPRFLIDYDWIPSLLKKSNSGKYMFGFLRLVGVLKLNSLKLKSLLFDFYKRFL